MNIITIQGYYINTNNIAYARIKIDDKKSIYIQFNSNNSITITFPTEQQCFDNLRKYFYFCQN